MLENENLVKANELEKDKNKLTNLAVNKIVCSVDQSLKDSIISKIKEQQELINLLPTILKEKLKLSLVGGSLRDLIYSKEIKDLDFLISGPAQVNFSDEYKDLFKILAEDDRESFISSVVQELKKYKVLSKNLSEDEFFEMISDNRKISDSPAIDGVYFFDILHHVPKPETYPEIPLNDVFKNMINVNLFYFLLNKNVELVLQNKKIDFTSGLMAKKTTQEELLEGKYIDNQAVFKTSKSQVKVTREKELILNYSVIDGVNGIIKIPSKDGLSVDLILSFLPAIEFVKSFDINLLEVSSEIQVSDLVKVNSFDDLVNSINLSNKAYLGYKNKTLIYSFLENELLEFGDLRQERYKSRILKNRNIFKDFDFKVLCDNLLVYENISGKINSTPLEKVNIDVDAFNMASNIVRNTLLSEKKSLTGNDEVLDNNNLTRRSYGKPN